jgi:signal transduction histidine kinase
VKRIVPPLPDAAVALAIVLVEVGGAALTSRERGEPGVTPVAILLLLLQSLPVAWARRAPVPVWAITAAAALVYGIRDYPDPFLPLGPIVALFVVVALRPPPTAVVVGVCSLAIAGAGALLAGDSDAQDVAFAIVLVALGWVLGVLQRRRDERAATDQAAAMRDAVLDERTRIARELHDVVAHHVSMMVVQSEAGASTAASEQDLERFEATASTGRDALTDLRRLLGVLRASDASVSSDREPQPGLDRLDDLVRSARRAGLSVDVTVEGEPRSVPPGVGLSAYRIVQEALTNTIRHAGPAHASVAVRYSTDALEVEVVDDGTRAASANGDGFGLVGIRERVALYGGSLSVGARHDGGFAVAARLPVRTP